MRIVAGAFGGRRIGVPRGGGTRPTSDRVREALFSILGSEGCFAALEKEGEEGVRVLDLYAGSGALALEAISRGAASATLVENARPALAAIHENLASLDVVGQVTVVAAPVRRALASLEGTFDLVLVDPPYADVRAKEFPEIVAAVARLLAAAGILVLEHASIDAPTFDALEMGRRRRYGDTTLSLFVHRSVDRPAEEEEKE